MIFENRPSLTPMPKFRIRSATMAMILIPLLILCLVMLDSAFAARLPGQETSAEPAASASESPAPPPTNIPLTLVDGRIGRQPIYNVLVARGVAPSEVLSLARSFKGIFDFRNARPKDEYQAYLTPQKKLQKLTYIAGPDDQYVAVRTDNGAFHTYRREISLELETVARTFTIESSLYLAVTEQGESSQLVSAFADIFSWDIDFYLYPRKGDIIRILFEKYSLNGQFIKYGKIIAAQYISPGNTFSAFYFDDGQQAGYYDEKGIPLRKMFLRVPVKFGMRTSSFSVSRFHPISKIFKRHTGIDYSAAQGTPIFATAAGTVEFAGWRSGYGKLVVIRHPNGYKTYYGHCSRLLVTKGTYVKQEQTIARVGQTGNATGPHVHYETRINGKPVNPNSIKSTKGPPLPSDQQAMYEHMVQTRLLMMEENLYSENQQNGAKPAN